MLEYLKNFLLPKPNMAACSRTLMFLLFLLFFLLLLLLFMSFLLAAGVTASAGKRIHGKEKKKKKKEEYRECQLGRYQAESAVSNNDTKPHCRIKPGTSRVRTRSVTEVAEVWRTFKGKRTLLQEDRIRTRAGNGAAACCRKIKLRRAAEARARGRAAGEHWYG